MREDMGEDGNKVKILDENLKKKEEELATLKKNSANREEKFKQLINHDRNNVKILNEKLKKKEEEVRVLSVDLKRKDEDFENLRKKYSKLETDFFGPIDTTVDLSTDDKNAFNDCVEFINLNATTRSNISLNNRAIDKKIRTIKNLENTSKNLFKKCE